VHPSIPHRRSNYLMIGGEGEVKRGGLGRGKKF